MKLARRISGLSQGSLSSVILTTSASAASGVKIPHNRILTKNYHPPSDKYAITIHDGTSKEIKEDRREHQLASGAGDEIRERCDRTNLPLSNGGIPFKIKQKANCYGYVVTLGYKSTLKSLRSGKAKLVIISGNTPPLRKSELECKPRC